MQVICDVDLRIIFICVAGPGKMNDARAYIRVVGLQTWTETLDAGYFCSGNNAYSLSNPMLIPYSGTQRDGEYYREYKFYSSQLRIWIEMCFGRLSIKWKIFVGN